MGQHFIALPFVTTSAGLVPGSPVECLSAEVAIMRAKALFSLPNTAGAVAFSCTVDPHRAAYPDAVVLMRLGDVPDDLP
jgi:hypothetical protein